MTINQDTGNSKMANDTIETSQEAHNQATSEAATAPIGAMWVALVPMTENAATDPIGDDDDEVDDPKSNSKLKLTVGKRFSDARELNGFGQTQAALLMGWKNATQLSLIEQGKRMPPHQVLIIASTVLGTSVDFLLGLSSEPERDPKKAEQDAAMRHVHHLIEKNAQSMTGMLLQYLGNVGPSVASANRLMTGAQVLINAITRVRELNPRAFDEELKGGARLIAASQAMTGAMHDVRKMLKKHERITEYSLRRGRAAVMSTNKNQPMTGSAA